MILSDILKNNTKLKSNATLFDDYQCLGWNKIEKKLQYLLEL